MSNVGQRERATQNRIVQFFQTDLGYRYFGKWESIKPGIQELLKLLASIVKTSKVMPTMDKNNSPFSKCNYPFEHDAHV